MHGIKVSSIKNVARCGNSRMAKGREDNYDKAIQYIQSHYRHLFKKFARVEVWACGIMHESLQYYAVALLDNYQQHTA